MGTCACVCPCSFSNLMYSVLLGRLRGVNEHIDRIIEHTPLMVRDALYKARVEKLEKDKYPGLIPPPPEETSAGVCVCVCVCVCVHCVLVHVCTLLLSQLAMSVGKSRH